MTTNRRISFLFLIFIFILVTGCAGWINNTQPTQIIPSKVVETRTPGQPKPSPTRYKWSTPTSPPIFVQWAMESKQWLNGIPCSAPCWGGIIPGKTSIGEAITLLKNNPTINPETVQIIRALCGGEGGSEVSYSRKLTWKWSVSPEYYSQDGSIYYSQENLPETYTCPVDFFSIENVIPDSSTNNAIVSRVTLDFPGPMEQNENYFLLPTLGEVMEAYGEPSHVVAVYRPEYSWYHLMIIYEKQGFVLIKDARALFELDQDTYFVHLVFSTNPVQDGLGGFDVSVLNIWQGLKSYNFYCKFETGQPCQ